MRAFVCAYVNVCVCVSVRARLFVWGEAGGGWGVYVCYLCSLHLTNNIGTFLNLVYLSLFIRGLHCYVLFVNAPYEWNVTKTIPLHM